MKYIRKRHNSQQTENTEKERKETRKKEEKEKKQKKKNKERTKKIKKTKRINIHSKRVIRARARGSITCKPEYVNLLGE